MKITWTIAALASSVTLVDAQATPRRAPPVAPAPVVTPTPAPRPRAERPMEPLLAGVDWLLDAPGAMLAPEAFSPLTPFPPLPPLEPMMALEPLMELPMPPFEVFTPMAPLAPLAPMAPLPSMAVDMPMMPFPPMSVEPMFDLLPGQGPVTPRPVRERELDAELRRLTQELDRAETARQRAAAAQDRALQRELETQERTLQRQLEQTIRNIEAQDRAVQRQIEMQDRVAQREFEQQIRSVQHAAQADVVHSVEAIRSLNLAHLESGRVMAPTPWASQDIADSAYRQARELFNRGEWGQAVQAFRALPTRYPNSAYAPEAAYYQAFSLFRIGGTTELREALGALEASRTKYPNARSKTEMTNLATRIRGVLAQRGDAQAAAELARTANQQTVTCDREEQAVQAEAMNALSRSDAGNVNDLITRVLARKDECAIPLRRTAIFLVGQRRDAQAVTILAGVSRNDPSVDVRVEAIGVLSRLPNEESVPVLEELVRDSDERVQRAAIRSLVRHPSARAKAAVRALVERDDVSERVRSEALSAFNSESATAEDITWLRTLYSRFTTPTLKARALAAIVRVGGPEVDQWLVTIARDDNQPSELRATAMRRIGQTLPIADLGRLYDSATQQRFRSEIISVLGKRKEDAAADKLIDIVKNGTDPSLRNSAIRAISGKNDARATQLLLDIINK